MLLPSEENGVVCREDVLPDQELEEFLHAHGNVESAAKELCQKAQSLPSIGDTAQSPRGKGLRWRVPETTLTCLFCSGPLT